LCSSAAGTLSGLPVRNTAVPGTRTMRERGRRAMKGASSAPSCRRCASISSRPRSQDVISALLVAGRLAREL